jgi:3-hydroxyisobutyrate dehydrogenase
MADQTAVRPRVALLGTGIMGTGMGRNMLKAGLPVRAWNRTRAKADRLAGAAGDIADTPAEAVQDADIIVTMLTDAAAVASSMTAAGPALRAGQLWIQSSTVGLAGCDQLADLARENDLVFVDAPVLGTRQPAEQGELIVLAAGPPEAENAVRPVFDAIGKRTMWLGPAGNASRLKLVINSWVLNLMTSAAEALALAEGLGVDPQLFLDAVGGGPLDCRYLQAKAAAILKGDLSPDFTVKMAAKDGRLVAQAAQAAGIRLDVGPAAAARFARAAGLGHDDQDMAATYYASF